MLRKSVIAGLVLMLGYAWSAASYAEVSGDEVALAKESEAKCAATAKDKPEVQGIINKVKQAAALLQKEGAKSFPKFQGKDSEYIFNGTYIWIHGLDGKMLMHPIKPAMVGQDVLSIKDVDGKKIFAEMNNMVEKNTEGWVEYKWPKPGQKESSTKISYVHGATLDDKKVVVGCGVYDLTMKDIETALKKTVAEK